MYQRGGAKLYHRRTGKTVSKAMKLKNLRGSYSA